MSDSPEVNIDLEALFDSELDRRRQPEGAWGKVIREPFLKLCRTLVSILAGGGKILVCGNGGSAAQAQHFVAELIGRYKQDRAALPAVALTTDTSALTAIGNDYGFNEIFRRQAEGLMGSSDLLIGLSTSGNSPNVVDALSWAKERGFATAAMTGEGGGGMAAVVDTCVAIPTTDTDLIQERHLVLLHILADVAERSLTETR
jgi:D-sedoheptulose 7-phosphate isomerase